MIIHRTAEERADLVKAFRAAKRHLSPTRFEGEKKSEYICWALGFAGVTHGQRMAARALIRQRLNGYATLAEWMYTTCPELRSVSENDCFKQDGRKMQQTRQAWLDSLIAEFSQPA